ncbi:MAG: Glycosyl transferase group 1 [Candidatus Magasanikbacteria bacterium GW2011_GWA2_56_11]|uniref:Glycosyl transferase group 1 n=1 Tax=Candidatus Magasanikbacteria bacterium GW2011_GWA2_56_11 TaxID=1619044 RepID=A0A0G1YF85_9BACT|nr:MAG: Glycosyl transferase group 1 [Candidatus Magasanikbacteria bacterium GW2011_GWA2_56_11]
MKLIYVANARLPTEKAHGLQIVSMCEALARSGADLTLLSLGPGDSAQDIFTYYNVEPLFAVEYLAKTPQRVSTPAAFRLRQLRFSWQVWRRLWPDRRKAVVLTRDELTGWGLSCLGVRVFYDMHGFPEHKRWLWKLALRALTGIVVTNHWKKRQCQERFRIPAEKMMVAPNGYDPRLFPVPGAGPAREDLRRALGFPAAKKVVLYTGNFYDWKGVHTLGKAAALLPETAVWFVGGSEEEAVKFRDRYRALPNVRVLSYRPHAQIPQYLQAADVLVLPNSARAEDPRFAVYSQFDTSPMKLFEYMGSGTPIVATDLPSVREIIDETTAEFFPPDDPDRLAAAIKEVLENETAAKLRAGRARERVAREFTWDRRSGRLLEFIRTRIQ